MDQIEIQNMIPGNPKRNSLTLSSGCDDDRLFIEAELQNKETILKMGNNKSCALSKDLLEDLKTNTTYTEEQLYAWYQAFLKECPSGYISIEQFESIYARFFPDANPKAYAQHVFRSFDSDSNGTLDFKEFVVALHLTSSGKTIQKLEWAFALFDVDKNGSITKNEINEIVTSIFNMISEEDQKNLPEDENTPEKRTAKIWAFFGKKEKDKITEGEFIKGLMDNKNILRLIQLDEPQRIQNRLKRKK